MDAVEEGKKRIAELKRKKEELVSKGQSEEEKKVTTSGYFSCFSFVTNRIRFRNYTPSDDGLRTQIENVVVSNKGLSYEEELKEATKMPSVRAAQCFNCRERMS